jgi:AcrR family transcriptional regulator
MIGAVAQNGYVATPVADVIARAGVSRKTFYEHFANKQECMLFTYDLIAEELERRIAAAARQADGWPGALEASIRVLFEAAIENPAAVRLSLVEVAAAGPEGVRRRERAIAGYRSSLRDALEPAPREGTVSELVLRTIVGGISSVLYRRVSEDRCDELLALVPELSAWASSYVPTPPSISERQSHSSPWLRRGRRRLPALEGGRAPGTLAPHSGLGTRRGLARGDQNVSRSYVVHSQRERILDAVANLVADTGYAELKVEDIAELAAVSLKAFYEHFEDKEDAFLVAFEVGQGKGLAMVEAAYTAERDWTLSTRAGLTALLDFLAGEPAFAHLALVEALVATPRSAERARANLMTIAHILVPRSDEAPGIKAPPNVTIEAIAGGVFGLCLDYALQGRICELRELTATATYFTLAPILGGKQAARIATAPHGSDVFAA